MRVVLLILLLALASPPATAHDPKAKPASSKVDPAKEAEHRKDDIRKHRAIAAAHEAAARCLEAGKDEAACTADLARACKGIALGKHCGMRHD